MEGVELSPAQRPLAASLRASTLSLLLPSFNKALRRGLQDHNVLHLGLQQIIQPGDPGPMQLAP